MRIGSICRYLVLAIAVATAVPGRGPAPARAAEAPMIAVLDTERILSQSKAGTSLRQQIDKVRTANQAVDREAEKALLAQEKELMAQRSVLSDEAFAQKRGELEARLNALREDFAGRQDKLNRATNKAWIEIRDALIEVAQAIAAERNIEIVVPKEAVVLTKTEYEITDEALARIDEILPDVRLTGVGN